MLALATATAVAQRLFSATTDNRPGYSANAGDRASTRLQAISKRGHQSRRLHICASSSSPKSTSNELVPEVRPGRVDGGAQGVAVYQTAYFIRRLQECSSGSAPSRAAATWVFRCSRILRYQRPPATRTTPISWPACPPHQGCWP